MGQLTPWLGVPFKSTRRVTVTVSFCLSVVPVVDCAVRIMLERMGKTMFFRSGQHPLILTEEQREERKRGENSSAVVKTLLWAWELLMLASF